MLQKNELTRTVVLNEEYRDSQEMGSVIEAKYQESLDRMTGLQRVERTSSLFTSILEMLTLQIIREFGSLSDQALRKKVAERLYSSDPLTQMLLKKVSVEE